MSKLAESQKSFREKRADWSIRINANGFMALLPREAVEAEVAATSLFEIVQGKKAQIEALESAIKTTPQKCRAVRRDLNNKREQLAKNVDELVAVLQGAKDMAYCQLFHFVAAQLLTPQCYIFLIRCTNELHKVLRFQQRAKQHWSDYEI